MANQAPKIDGNANNFSRHKNSHIFTSKIIGLGEERFIEKILVGRKYHEAPIITSRICGMCSHAHSITSTKAIEKACNISPSYQTKELRKLMLCGQMIQSHSAHLYMHIAPDYLGQDSFFELQKDHPIIFNNAVVLKKYADLIVQYISGRIVHPISNVVGGFTKIPDTNMLRNILKYQGEVEEIAEATVRFFASLDLPSIKRNIIYSSLFEPRKYAFYEGDIKTSNGHLYNANNYRNYLYEELMPYNHIKFASLRGDDSMVGAIARSYINRHRFDPKVLTLISNLNILHNYDNPFENILAQAIECYHFVIESENIIKELLKNDLINEKVIEPKTFFKGASACEGPRGTLFYYYEIDKNGYITKCDIITPTVQSLSALESDIKNLAPLLQGKSKSDKDSLIEMLVKAYDTCATCAIH